MASETRRLLHLLRHAKSSWDEPVEDRDRPLSSRGERAGELMAAHLREAGVRPQLVLCSPARRTRETLALVAPALGEPEVRYEEGLYLTGAGDLLERLRRVPADVSSCMVVGHLPTLQDLALWVAGSGDAAAHARLRAKLPTGALVTLALPDGGWPALDRGSAELVAFVVPRDLG